MAHIAPGPVTLTIEDSGTDAIVSVSYTITASTDEAPANYRELVQLYSKGRHIGEPGSVHPVPGGTVWDGTAAFTTDQVSFPHTRQLTLPLADLTAGTVSPAEPNGIFARVTLTALPPTQDSNVVQVSHPAVAIA